jgi:glycosyltransferase involved in cell wall biosynthesis
MPLYAMGVDGAAGIANSVGLLTKHLQTRGHDVDVYTVGASRLPFGNKVEVFERGVFEHASTPAEGWVWDAAGMLKVGKMIAAKSYDIIHNNGCSYTGFLEIAPRKNCLTTIRISAGWNGFPSAGIAFAIDPSIKTAKYVAVSDNQRATYPGVNFLATVHNGIELDAFRKGDGAGGYIAWLGRLDAYKGLDHAGEACKRAGAKLHFAGSKRDPAVLELALSLAKQPGNEFVGYADPARRNDLLGNARAVLAPSLWDEPFGYVNVEAMACGTPVIAYSRGANSEVVEHGVTGFLVPPDDQDALADAVRAMLAMPDARYQEMRRAARDRVARLFTIARVVDDYERLYRQVLAG